MVDGPATDQAVTSTVTIDAGGVVVQRSDDITAPACEGPALPPEVTFTFSVDAERLESCRRRHGGVHVLRQNTSTIPLEVVRLVDDRLGVVLEGEAVVAPGESVCNTDVGATGQPRGPGNRRRQRDRQQRRRHGANPRGHAARVPGDGHVGGRRGAR